MQENCELLRHYFILENTDDALSSTFIQDKQQLESVLGVSQDSWFESLTARQIQCQKSNSVRPKCSVFDSPSCSPTVSQMLRGHLSVGSSPSVLRHSSPAPYCDREESFNARLSLGTPQSHGWERPMPCLSPGPSPIVQNKSILSHPSSSGVYSLGLDDSNLSWTNSLATPPRDPDQMDLHINGTESLPTRTKETARALFSPGNRQDTSADSVLPLDSTFEEDQSDLDGSRSDFSHKNVTQSNKNGSQNEVIKHIDNLKIRFNKRLITRKDSLTESSKKFRSKHGSNSCDLDNDSAKKTKLHQETVTDSISSSDSQDYSLSPTFSQKSKCSKVKSCKPQNPPSGNERSFIEDVLSDFFDPPAASVGKRKPAPTKKRKSLEMEDTVIDVKSTAEDVCERSGSAVDISTPKGSLLPILASDKKTRSSSNKKVRFSDNVQKCTFIPEYDTSFEKRAHKKSARKKMLNKKEKTFSQHENSPCAESVKNEQVKENKSKVENEKNYKKSKNAKVRGDLKPENSNDFKQKDSDATHKCSKNVYENNKRQTNEFVKNETNTNQINGAENQEVSNAVRQDKETDKEMEDLSVSGVLEENSEEELFSQVSPSALKEMCNVAEKPVTSEEIKGKDVTITVENRDTGEILQKPLKIKRFFYPSVNHISDATSTKVFQFREDERKELNKKVLLSSVKLEDVVNKELNVSIDSMKQSKEVDENLPEHVENITNNKVKDKQDSAMQEMVVDNISNKSSHLQIGSGTHSAEVLEEFSATHFRSEMGFQSAAGKPFSMSDQALKKAATLLLEDSSDTSPALESLCNLAKDPKDLHHSVAVPNSMVKSVIKDKPQIEPFTELMDNDGHAPQGFKSASGKDVHISSKALVKASAIFSEDLPDSKSGLRCNSGSESMKTMTLTQSVGKGAKTDEEYKADTLSSIPPQTLEKEKHVFHREKLTKEVTQNQVQSKLISLPVSFTGMCNGFQLASGKEIQLPEMALEKAASLLQEKNTELTPLNDSQIKNKTDVNAEYGNEDALIEDIEFSEWCEEDMEPDENLQIVPILEDANKAINGNGISGEHKENILNRNVHALDNSASKVVANSETKIHENTKEVTQTEEIDVNKQVLIMSEVNDQKPKHGKACLDKSVNSNDDSAVNRWHGRAGKDEKLKASFPAQEEKYVKTDTERDSDSKTSIKDEDVNCIQSKQTIPCSDSNFVGFQTAGGRSLAFSAEKLKHAEKLLNDSETEVTQTLNSQIDHDENSLIVRKAKNLYTKNTDDEEIRSNGVRSKKGLIRTELPDVNRQSENTLVLGRDYEVKNDTFLIKSRGIQKNIVKELGKKSVGERLMLEFENDMVVDGKQTNELKCAENELKHLADFKKSRMEKKETSKFLPAPAETSKKVPIDRNVPQGFRPFKPPKITKFSSQEKYPKSVVNDVECTKQPHTESVNSDRFNQNTTTNDISLKTTMKKNVLYPESKLKVWEQGRDSSENNKHITQNDKIKSTNKIITIDNPFAGSNTIYKHDSDKTGVSIVDLEGISHMFEDDMDFTQSANFGMNECSKIQNAAEDKKENSKTAKEDKEISLKDRVLESESKLNKEDVNCTESMSFKESIANRIGFSTASGISVSVSATTFKSAVKMLSKCDEGGNMQDSKQLDLNNDEDKIVIVTNINEETVSADIENNIKLYPAHKEYHLEKAADEKKCEDFEDGISYENVSVREEKQSNKIPCMNNTAAVEQSQNVIKEVKKSEHCYILGSTVIERTKSGQSLCQFDHSDGNSSNKSYQTREEIEYKLPKFAVISECEQTFFGKEGQKQPVCVFQTASGKVVDISSEALTVARKTLNGVDDGVNANSANSKCAVTMVGDSVVPECTVDNSKPASSEKLESVNQSNGKTLSKYYKNHPKPVSSEFSTASEKKIEVSEIALKHVESHLAVVEDITENSKSSCSGTEVGDKVSIAKTIEVMESSAVKNTTDSFVFRGFRTASGDKVHISEKALQHAKASLANETDSGKTEHNVNLNDINTALNVTELVTGLEIRNNNSISKNHVKSECFGSLSSNVGFSTASGKKVSLSDNALNPVRNTFTGADRLEINETETELVKYETISSKKDSVFEEAEYVNEELITSDNTNRTSIIQKFEGFSTAAGKKVNVSDNALQHAKQVFENIHKTLTKLEDEPNFIGLSTDSEIQTSKIALKNTKEKITDSVISDRNITETGNIYTCFGSALDNKEELLDKTVKQASGHLSEVDQLNNPQSTETMFPDFRTTSGSIVKVSENASKHAKENLSEINCFNRHNEDKMKFGGFSTASGKNVQVSKEALKHTKACLSDSDSLKLIPESKIKLSTFDKANLKMAELTEEPLIHSRMHMTVTDGTIENQGFISNSLGFKTASGKTVNVAERALKHAKESLMETSYLYENPEPEKKINGFSKASVKHRMESSKETTNYYENQEPETKFQGFSTASGKTVTVAEKALKHAKESFVETTNFFENQVPEINLNGFKTASGKTVMVSEKALKHAKGSFVETPDGYESPEPEKSKFQGFSTASGKTVKVSEKALKHAKEPFVETPNSYESPEPETKFQGFSTASGKPVQDSEKALKHAKETTDLYENPETETNFNGFSTASGKPVQVSEKALKHAKETTDLYENPQPETNFSGFSTASGKSVKVSEKALKHAKESLVETSNFYESPEPETKFHGFSSASGKTKAISEQALKYAKKSFLETTNFFENQEPESNFCGFKTASGNRVGVLKEALEKVKDHLSLAETTGIPGFDPAFAGFGTALGNKIQVSEKALIYVKKNLLEKDSLNIDQKAETGFSGFCTASGKTVEVSETALKLATDSHNKIPEDVDSINQFDKNQTSAYSERISKLHQGNQMEQIHVGNSETEIGGADFEEMFGMALKRRKLDMNRERRMVQNLKDEDSLHKRKAVKNTPKGNTDQRHPGFRPFKPVFCKALDKQQRRQDVSAVSQSSYVTKNIGSTRPSLSATFKTSSEKPTALNSSVGSSEQEMMVKTQSCTTESVSNQGQGDGEETKSVMKSLKACMLPSGDCKQKLERGVNDGIQTPHISDISDLPRTDSREMEQIENKANQLGSKIDAEIPVEIQGSTRKCKIDISKEKKASIIEETVKSDGLDTTQASDHGDFDSFSQDEDDVYYCMLVEARRHQDNIIKQRGADRVRPVVGRLWKMKQTQNRWKLKDLIDNLDQEQHKSNANVTSGNAVNHKFSLESHCGKNTAHVTVGDGAFLVPDDSGKVGKQEFFRAFLTMEGIDGSLVSEAWVYNHYRWIVWKLAAYEKTSTCLRSRCLTPEMVMLQLKYRYDREVDLSQRSAIKKIYERDDTPSKRLVLCVTTVKRHNQDGSTVDQSKTVLDEAVILELTDGWYSIPAQIDSPLTQLVLRGKINVGHKLCVTGAELVGGEDACTPLEAPSSVMLRICRNSTRPAPWDSVLGYQGDPRPLCVPLSDIHCDGGIVGVVDVVIVRKCPTLFMEKFEGGGCIFRTGRCEDRARQEYEVKKQTEMEKLYRQMENIVEKEQKQEKKVGQRKKFSRTEIEELQSGLDIFEAMEEAGQPDMVQNYLSEHQLSMLYEYQRVLQEQKQMELNSRFQKAWQERLEVFQERSVTPVLKFRVAGCANRDLDQNTSTILTVWRPADEISELQEGHRYKIYSLSASASRSKYTGHTVQLTATKQTRFRHMQLDENILDTVYEPREVLWVVDLKRRQPPYGELDFVGIIVNITQSSVSDRICDTVYLADCQTGILAIRFWNGYKTFGEDLFVMGSVLCCSNLMDKSSYRSLQIPTVEVSAEFTHITNKSQNTAQRKAVDKLLSVAKDKKAFLEKAGTVLDQLLNENINKNIPKKILGITNEFIKEFPRSNVGKESLRTCQTGSGSVSSVNDTEEGKSMSANENQKIETFPLDDRTDCKSSVDLVSERKGVSCKAEISQTDRRLSISDLPDVSTPVIERKRSIAQAKMARLMTYGSPSVLSPLSTTLPRSVTKGFKPPAFKKL